MNISKKWRAATAGVIALALVGTGATAAHAAPWTVPTGAEPANPQSNGSLGSFFVWDGETGEYADGDDALVYGKSRQLLISGNSTDIGSEIKAPAEAAGFTQVYRFVAKPSEMWNGVNTWRAYDNTMATGPTGGVIYDNYTLGDKIYANNGGIDSVFTEGGEWNVGIAFTTNNGVTPLASIYRTVVVDAATDTYTIKPVEFGAAQTAPVITQQPVSASRTAGEDAVFTAAATGNPAPTVKWQSSTDGNTWSDIAGETNPTLTVPAVTLTQSGTSYRAVFTNGVDPDAITNTVQLTVSAAVVEPTDATHAATKTVTIAQADGKVTLEGVTAGTYRALAWPGAVSLGNVTVDASGVATIEVPEALQDGASHTFALLQSNNEVAAWNAIVVPAPEFTKTSNTQVTAAVTNSNKFALEGVATTIDLGTAKRGATTAPKALGAFTVTDDRDNLLGWRLTAAVSDFTGAAGTIPGSALGIAPKKVGDAVDGITAGAATTAGSTTASTLVAEGAADSLTVEAGTQFDADLTFKAPEKAKKGTYTSTLTLTLASK